MDTELSLSSYYTRNNNENDANWGTLWTCKNKEDALWVGPSLPAWFGRVYLYISDFFRHAFFNLWQGCIAPVLTEGTRSVECWNLFLAHQQLMSFIKRFFYHSYSTYSCHSKICGFGITAVINSSHLRQLPRCFYLFVGSFSHFFFGANSFSAPADADRTHATWVNSAQWDQNSTFKQLSRHWMCTIMVVFIKFIKCFLGTVETLSSTCRRGDWQLPLAVKSKIHPRLNSAFARCWKLKCIC